VALLVIAIAATTAAGFIIHPALGFFMVGAWSLLTFVALKAAAKELGLL
jgi:hypothetical protein